MGSRNYGGEIDIWAVGCIFAELWLRIPYIQGNTDIEQLKEIFKALGTPSESDWPVKIFSFFSSFFHTDLSFIIILFLLHRV